MLVKENNNARSFLDDYETIMLEQEAVSQLVLYSAYHGCQDIEDENSVMKAMYGAVLDHDIVTLLFCNVIPYNLVIYIVKQENSLQASETLADYMGSNHIVINGIYAKLDVCQGFMEVYKKYMKCSFAEKLGIDILEIREVNDLTPMEGVHRLALPEEAKLAAQWMIEFQLESLASELDYEAAVKRATKLINEEKIYFYEDIDNKVVSMAVAARKLAHGTTITYVFTPEENRGKGYAAANIYYLSRELLEQGNEFCTLFVDKKNMLSSRAYEKVGYKAVGDLYEYKVILTES